MSRRRGKLKGKRGHQNCFDWTGQLIHAFQTGVQSISVQRPHSVNPEKPHTAGSMDGRQVKLWFSFVHNAERKNCKKRALVAFTCQKGIMHTKE